MRAYVPSYQLASPTSLAEALEALSQNDQAWKPFAGGTDLMVLLEAGKLPHQNYVNIWNLRELGGIEVSDEATARDICQRACHHGLLTRNIRNVIVLMLPLCTTTEQLNRAARALADAIVGQPEPIS